MPALARQTPDKLFVRSDWSVRLDASRRLSLMSIAILVPERFFGNLCNSMTQADLDGRQAIGMMMATHMFAKRPAHSFFDKGE